MREDMKDVLVTPGRYGKYSGSRRIRQSNDLEKLESLPEREGMAKPHSAGYWGWEYGDHINPLRRWLKSNVNRPFSKVYSEFCEHADDRSVRGWHARNHFWMEVDTLEERELAISKRWSRPSRFYIDKNDILREDKTDYSWRHPKKEQDPNRCSIGDRHFERINNCWFEIFYEKREVSRKRYDYFTETTKIEYYTEEVKTKQRQLSKKDLKELGLKNGSDFLWWKV